MPNVKCSICGKEYEACNSCLEQKTFKPWRTVTDTVEHYKIYFVIHEYTISKDREKAKKDLKNCDLCGLDDFVPEIKNVIQEIMEDTSKTNHSLKTKRVKNTSTISRQNNDK